MACIPVYRSLNEKNGSLIIFLSMYDLLVICPFAQEKISSICYKNLESHVIEFLEIFPRYYTHHEHVAV